MASLAVILSGLSISWRRLALPEASRCLWIPGSNLRGLWDGLWISLASAKLLWLNSPVFYVRPAAPVTTAGGQGYCRAGIRPASRAVLILFWGRRFRFRGCLFLFVSWSCRCRSVIVVLLLDLLAVVSLRSRFLLFLRLLMSLSHPFHCCFYFYLCGLSLRL